MTTGRINQVTTFRKHRRHWRAAMSTKLLGEANEKATFLSVGVRSLGLINFKTLWPEKNPLGFLCLWPQGRNRLVPRSHTIQTALASLLVTAKEDHGLLRELPCDRQASDIKYPCSPGHGGFPSVLIASKLSHRQASPHSFPLCKQQHKRLCAWPHSKLEKIYFFVAIDPFQISITCCSQRCIIDSAQDKPANPHFLNKKQKGILNLISTFMQLDHHQRSSRSLY